MRKTKGIHLTRKEGRGRGKILSNPWKEREEEGKEAGERNGGEGKRGEGKERGELGVQPFGDVGKP